MRRPTPQPTFDRIADRYDLVNGLLSLGLDRRWRRRAARTLAPAPGARILDAATGTGSFARAALEEGPPGVRCVAFDLNLRMLLAGRRSSRSGRSPVLRVCAAAEAIPLPDGAVEGAGLAFALDDTRDPELALREIGRVLAPGGRVALLELSLPPGRGLAAAYRLFLRLLPVVERLARLPATLSHLRSEILAYRGPEAVRRLLEAAELGGYRRHPLSLGIATLHLADKPLPDPRAG